MASVKYSYAKAVDAGRLIHEIGLSPIVTALDYVTSTTAMVDIWFKATLSPGDETTLTSLVNAHVNTPLPFPAEPSDSDGSRIVRNKTTKSGWHYEPRFINFTTGVYNSLNNTNADGNDIGDATLSFYNASGDLLVKGDIESDVAFQARLDLTCVKTYMDWWPTYDWDVIGMIFKIMSVPSTMDLLYAIAAPDIPANLGGSVPLTNGGVPLNFFQEKEIVYMDGRGAKPMLYNAQVPSSKIRMVVRHALSSKSQLLFAYEHYKA